MYGHYSKYHIKLYKNTCYHITVLMLRLLTLDALFWYFGPVTASLINFPSTRSYIYKILMVERERDLPASLFNSTYKLLASIP